MRADTPATADQIFLDSAGASLPPIPVVEAVVAHVRREAEIGGYLAEEERAEDLVRLKGSLGRLLNCEPGLIALTDSATRAWAQFFYAVKLAPGDRILLSGAEYASNAVAALQRARATGAAVQVVPSDESGQIDLDALKGMLDERVRLVSLVHVPTNGGLVNPAREVAELAHQHGALVLLDACQSVGQLRVDVAELGVDALSGTSRKWLRGPRGAGFLYLRAELAETLEPPMIDLRGAEWEAPDRYRLCNDASRFELWEADVAARLGLGVAVEYLLELGIDDVERAVGLRAAHLRAALATIAGVRLRDLGQRHCGIVSFTLEGHDPVDVRDALVRQGITVTVSHAPSTLLDMTSRKLPAVVRASPHYFVTTAQLDAAARAVEQLARTPK